MMRIGIGSYTYPWAVGVPGHFPPTRLTPLDLLERAAKLGVRVVQICDNLPLDALSEPELDTLCRAASASGIQIEVGTRGIQAAHLRTNLAIAQRLHSPILRVVIDSADHKPSADEVVRLLAGVMPEFEAAGVCLAIENHDRFTAATFADIITRIGSSCVGICLDTVNSFGATEGPAVVVDALAPFVVNLHVKDFAVRRQSYNLGFTVEGRPAGQGQLNIPWLLEAVRAAGRDPNAILELWLAPEPQMADTLAKELAWTSESISYLRTLIPD